jgi:hypothetical protein
MFRTVKTLLETRPIFHKCDETIRNVSIGLRQLRYEISVSR